MRQTLWDRIKEWWWRITKSDPDFCDCGADVQAWQHARWCTSLGVAALGIDSEDTET